MDNTEKPKYRSAYFDEEVGEVDVTTDDGSMDALQ
jgi:hypothetical protein